MATGTFVTDSTLTADIAFARMIDLARVPEWDRGITGSRLVDGEPGSVGARYEIALTGFDGKPTTAMYELTSVDPDRAFTMVGTNPTFRAVDTLRFEPSDDGCRVSYDAELTPMGDPPPVSDAQLASTFAAIVAIAEAGVSSYLEA